MRRCAMSRGDNGNGPLIDVSGYNESRDLAPREEYKFTILRVPLAEFKPAPTYRMPARLMRWIVVLQVILFGAIMTSISTTAAGLFCGASWLVIIGIWSVLWAREG